MGRRSFCSLVDGFFAVIPINNGLPVPNSHPALLSPLKDGELRTRIESLASKLNFLLKHLYEIDGSKRSSHSNVYFFGLSWVRRLSSYF